MSLHVQETGAFYKFQPVLIYEARLDPNGQHVHVESRGHVCSDGLSRLRSSDPKTVIFTCKTTQEGMDLLKQSTEVAQAWYIKNCNNNNATNNPEGGLTRLDAWQRDQMHEMCKAFASLQSDTEETSVPISSHNMSVSAFHPTVLKVTHTSGSWTVFQLGYGLHENDDSFSLYRQYTQVPVHNIEASNSFSATDMEGASTLLLDTILAQYRKTCNAETDSHTRPLVPSLFLSPESSTAKRSICEAVTEWHTAFLAATKQVLNKDIVQAHWVLTEEIPVDYGDELENPMTVQTIISGQ